MVWEIVRQSNRAYESIKLKQTMQVTVKAKSNGI